MEGMRRVFEVQLPLESGTDRYHTVARALTPEGAGDMVRALLSHMRLDVTDVRVLISLEAKLPGDNR